MRVGISSTETDADALLERVRGAAEMAGAELAGEVSTDEAYVVPAVGEKRFTVAALDLGIKAMTPHADGRARHRGARAAGHRDARRRARGRARRGVLLQRPRRPGGHRPARSSCCRARSSRGLPYFGICFGNQLFGRALGLRHLQAEVRPPRHQPAGAWTAPPARSRSPPTTTASRSTRRSTAPTETPYGAADGQPRLPQRRRRRGPRAARRRRRARGASRVQYHPEAAAGPHDAAYLFDRFVDLMRRAGAA